MAQSITRESTPAPSLEADPPLPADADTEPTPGGTLVYRPTADGLGRELAGFLDVTDTSALREELLRRGKNVGALYHLPTYRR